MRQSVLPYVLSLYKVLGGVTKCKLLISGGVVVVGADYKYFDRGFESFGVQSVLP